VFSAILGYASMGSARPGHRFVPGRLGRSLAAFNGLNLAGGVVGMAATGQALLVIGKPATLAVAVGLLGLASAFLWVVPRGAHRPAGPLPTDSPIH
jgi:hypothetical protein